MQVRTAIEIASDGTPLRVFHRQGASAWTHPIDDPAFKTSGRHSAIVSRPCPICTPNTGTTNGRAPEPRAGLRGPSP